MRVSEWHSYHIQDWLYSKHYQNQRNEGKPYLKDQILMSDTAVEEHTHTPLYYSTV